MKIPKSPFLSMVCSQSLAIPPSFQPVFPSTHGKSQTIWHRNFQQSQAFGLNQPFNHPLNRLSPSYIHHIPGSPMRDREILTKLGYLKLSSVSHPKNDPGYLTKSIPSDILEHQGGKQLLRHLVGKSNNHTFNPPSYSTWHTRSSNKYISY